MCCRLNVDSSRDGADMAAAGSQLMEDQFLCSICLEVFTAPVSTPCGHNFCQSCISAHWDLNVSCQCPICKRLFQARPELHVNTFISEMVAHFRRSAQPETGGGPELRAARPGEVHCDVCAGTRLKALKSCLVCLVSYCQTHLEPHLTAAGLRRHQLIEPVENLESRVCTQHGKPLELFCRDEQACICTLCSVVDHKAHDLVSLQDGYEVQKAELVAMEAELQHLIQQRQMRIAELKTDN
uniref:Uncharacterized protein n=1 Tax=Mola mola TaxID=94237 RepID=A0A3Q3X2S6_MOLML